MNASHFSSDTLEFIGLLYHYKVKYMIVGGEAVIYYGHPRLTGDVDFFYQNSSENVQALYKALMDFWNGNIPGLEKIDDLKRSGYVIQFGVPPNRIDILNEIEGVEFEDAWKKRKTEQIIINNESTPIYYIGLEHLIINKKMTGRGKDQEDLLYLENMR